jgi:hypothetical protein
MKNPLDGHRRRASNGASAGAAALIAALTCLSPRMSAASAAPALQLPPIADSANLEHHPGKIVWADLVTPDLAAAERFYGGLFGWSFRDIRAG